MWGPCIPWETPALGYGSWHRCLRSYGVEIFVGGSLVNGLSKPWDWQRGSSCVSMNPSERALSCWEEQWTIRCLAWKQTDRQEWVVFYQLLRSIQMWVSSKHSERQVAPQWPPAQHRIKVGPHLTPFPHGQVRLSPTLWCHLVCRRTEERGNRKGLIIQETEFLSKK